MPQTIEPSSKKRARWTDDELEALAARVNAGEELKDVAASLGKSYSSAYAHLKAMRQEDSEPRSRPRKRKSKAASRRKAAEVAPSPVRVGGFMSALKTELATLEQKTGCVRALIAAYDDGAAS